MSEESKKVKLLPCPFCGYSKPSIIIDEYAPIPYLGYGGGIEENVTCPQCLAHVDIKIWNNRHPMKVINEQKKLSWVELKEFIKSRVKISLNEGANNLLASKLAKDICQPFAVPEQKKLNIREEQLRDALDKAAYALFKVKRMGVSDQVREFCSEEHRKACEVIDAVPERRLPTVSADEIEKLSPLPWKLYGLDRPWNEFLEQCNQLSPDKEKYVGYCISAGNNDIVCLFGPGPRAYENAKMIEHAILALLAKTEGDK